MNIDNDYDNEGNNIVPCPICMSNYCPSKEDGKCPEEDMFAIECEIRMLLDEYKETGDRSRIANTLEFVEKIIKENKNQARQEERERAVEIIKDELRTAPLEVQMTKGIIFASIVGRIQIDPDPLPTQVTE